MRYYTRSEAIKRAEKLNNNPRKTRDGAYTFHPVLVRDVRWSVMKELSL